MGNKRHGNYKSGDGGKRSKTEGGGGYSHPDLQNVQFGQSAILISCDAGKESRAAKESIAFLREVILQEKIVGIERDKEKEEKEKKDEEITAPAPVASSNSSSTAVVSDLLLSELSEIRESDGADQEDPSGYRIRAFWAQRRQTGFAILQFFGKQFDIVQLVSKAFAYIRKTNLAQTRFTYRMIPLQKVCFANPDDLVKVAEKVLEDEIPKYSSEKENLTFRVNPKFRANQNFKRDQWISFLMDHAKTLSDSIKTDLTNPDIEIVVQVADRVAGISVIPMDQKHQWNDYNLHSLLLEKQQNQ